jgi:hypothetical protein
MAFVEFTDKDGHRIFLNSNCIVRVVASGDGTCLETAIEPKGNDKHLYRTFIVTDDIDTTIKKLNS